MANVNAPNGLTPIRYSNGALWNGQATMYCIQSGDTSQYGIGDVLIPDVGADANGIAYVKKGTATSANPIGVLVGVDPVMTNGQSLQGNTLSLETIAIPGTKTKNYYVYVVDDPAVIFEVQANNTTAQTAAATINQNAKLVVANPATGSPYSASVLDNTSFGGGTTLMFRVVGLSRKPNADFGAYARFLVQFNVHVAYGSAAGAA